MNQAIVYSRRKSDSRLSISNVRRAGLRMHAQAARRPNPSPQTSQLFYFHLCVSHWKLQQKQSNFSIWLRLDHFLHTILFFNSHLINVCILNCSDKRLFYCTIVYTTLKKRLPEQSFPCPVTTSRRCDKVKRAHIVSQSCTELELFILEAPDLRALCHMSCHCDQRTFQQFHRSNYSRSEIHFPVSLTVTSTLKGFTFSFAARSLFWCLEKKKNSSFSTIFIARPCLFIGLHRFSR